MWLLVTGFLCCGYVLGQEQLIHVGVLEGMEAMASKALSWVQGASRIRLSVLSLPQSELQYDRNLEAFNAIQDLGVHCVVGYHESSLAAAAEKMGVFYVSTSLGGGALASNVSLQVLPSASELTEPLLNVMHQYGWKTVGVIYEETLDHAVINTLVERARGDLKFWKLRFGAGLDAIREVLLALRALDVSNFLLLTRASVTRKIFTQARRLGTISKPFAWIALNLGSDDVVHGILDDLRTNVTLVNFVRLDSHVRRKHQQGSADIQDPIGAALITDSLVAIANAADVISLDDEDISTSRHRLASALQKVKFEGETGYVSFNEEGRRVNYTVDIFMYNGDPNILKIGDWKSHPEPEREKLSLRNMFLRVNNTGPFPLVGKTARVVTILERPFAMWKKDAHQYTGNARFEGFVLDMMEEISLMLDFRYELYPVPDGNFGAKMESGEWNGIMGQVLSGNATMSMASLSINTAREEAVDFTKPFMTRHIMVLMKTPESKAGYFQFMDPLSDEVWVCILASMFAVSLVLWGLEKHSSVVNRDLPQLNSQESVWFIFGSIVGGSTESTPVTIPGRIITSAWWFVALILTSTYTANLAAFLTVRKINPPISNVAELLGQTKIKYGTVRNSGIMNFMMNTRIEPFNKMWTQMVELFPESMVNSTEEGLQKVREGNYAFLWDNTVTSYFASVDCDVTEIGPPFDPKGFGMAVPPGATYLEELSLAMLKLADSGRIVELEQKWWSGAACADVGSGVADETTELELENVAGLFIVLCIGAVIALVVGIIEYNIRKAYMKLKLRRKEKETSNHINQQTTFLDNDIET